jgi:hypothetical protein
MPIGLTSNEIGTTDRGKIIKIYNIDWTTTSATTKSGNVLEIWECDDIAKTETKIYSVATGASTALLSKGMDDWGDSPICGGVGKRIVIREVNATVLSVPLCYVTYSVDEVAPAGMVNYACEA